jgi:hypothetical protein
VSAAWQLLGPVILGVVSSGSTSSALNNAQNLQAAQVIASDAKSSCNVDLSKVITGSATGK